MTTRSPGTANDAVRAELAAVDVDALMADASAKEAAGAVRFACRNCADTFTRAHDAIAHASTRSHVTYAPADPS